LNPPLLTLAGTPVSLRSELQNLPTGESLSPDFRARWATLRSVAHSPIAGKPAVARDAAMRRWQDISLPVAFQAAAFLALLGCACLLIVRTLHWPLVGDASLMHYVVFLMQHGMAPYRDIVDINMPGSYFTAWLGMQVFGTGALGLRVFDFCVIAAAGVAMIAIARPYGWFGGFFAASLLLILHIRDGVDQSGQRDLTAAVLLTIACALFFHAMRGGRAWAMALCGLCLGFASTIKPTVAPFAIVVLAMAVLECKQDRRPAAAQIGFGLLGFLLPWVAVFFFLLRERAVHAFWSMLTGLIPYHASIGRLPARYFVAHSIPSTLLPLAGLCVTAAWASKNWRNRELTTLWLGFAVGIISLFAQGKGYPYHRYPAEAFLLLLAGINFCAALKNPGILRVVGIVGLGLGAFALAPISTAKAMHYEGGSREFITSLQADLTRLGGKKLSGEVQCMDTTAGCINTLYDMRLVQDTGFLYDCYLFVPQPSPVQQKLRQRFWAAIETKPPEIFIVSDQLCVSGPSNYAKLDQWPQFREYLNSNYDLYMQRSPKRPVRWWSHAGRPFGYRIYVRKDANIGTRK
jgi:hypothetical protein